MIEWFDDLAIGMRFKSDEVQITESDIKRFAAEYDPQPMHLDEVAAAGYGVRAGERYRLKSRPAIRVTISTLETREAPRIADEIARALRPAARTSVA